MSFSDVEDDEDEEHNVQSDHESESQTPTPGTPLSPASPSPALSGASSPVSNSASTSAASKQPVKRRKSTTDSNEIELQKLVVLKQMAAKVDEEEDHWAIFGKGVANEMRQIKKKQNPQIES